MSAAPHGKGRAYVQLFMNGEPAGPPRPIGRQWVAKPGENRSGAPSHRALAIPESLEDLPVHVWARVLGRKPFELVADLMSLEVFVHADQTIPLATVMKLLKHFGYTITLEES